LKSPRAILIDGKEYQYDGLTEDHLGIISADQIFWMKPICFGDGAPVSGQSMILPEDNVVKWDDDSCKEPPEPRLLPPFGPTDIHKVSLRVPDLSAGFSDELKAHWKRVTTEWQKEDFERHFIKYPHYDNHCFGYPMYTYIGDLMKGAKSMSFEDFRRSRLAQELIWERHGTAELARQHHYKSTSDLFRLLDVYRFQTIGSLLLRIKLEASYPNRSLLYLADLIPDWRPDTKGSKVWRRTEKRRDKPNLRAHFDNDFSVAVFPQGKGEPFYLTVEPELRSLVKHIMEAGGQIPRTELRMNKPVTYQPEKLLRSRTAKAIVAAGLLGYQRRGRTAVFWAKSQAY
jgi:hypothetical protein